MVIKKIFFRLLFLGSFIACFFSQFANAQTTSFIHYGVEQGLPQSQVQSIVQDNDGNLWIGTLSGLTEYNGRTFKTYTKKDGLAEDWVTTSYKDKNGNLWFGHWAGSVTRYNAQTKKLDDLNLDQYTRFKTITSILEDDNGKIWIATEGAGIFIHDPATNSMISLSKKDGLSSDNVYALCKDNKNDIWIATDKGITIYDQKFDIGSPASFTKLNVSKGLGSNNITALALVNKNEMWVGTADAGVLVLKIPSDFSAKYPEKALDANIPAINSENKLESDFIETIYEARNHNIWIGTTGGGVTKITPYASADRDEAITKAIYKTYSTKQGLNYFNAKVVYQDIEGNIWIGTDLGLNQYRGERFQLFDEDDGLVNNLVWSVLCDHAGNIWLGTNNGVSEIIFSKSDVNNQEEHKIINYTTHDGLSSNVVLSIYEDSKNNMWFGTGFGGVCELPEGKKKFKSYSKDDGLAGNVVYAISEDNKNNMWFGTKEGASKFDPETKTFRNYTAADGLGGDNIYRIFKDSKGNLWFGALGGYLSMYDGTSFKTFDESTGITHRFILCITEDGNHNLWFGAYGGGLYKYDGKKFTNYNTNNGLSSDSPYSVIADKENNIWIGNSREIDKIDGKTSQVSHYGKDEGFLGVENNPNAICMDNNNNLWFGTIMGALKFNLSEDKPNTIEPFTAITGLKVFMKDTAFPPDAKFAYNQNHLTFEFVGVSLTSPQKVLYQYKLEGFDKDWSPGFTTMNEATYSNIPPGNYKFMVRACNNDGLWNTKPSTYSFFVAPPFWQTAIFYFLMFVLIVFAIYGFDKLRTSNLKKSKKDLQQKVAERTIELAVKNEELAEKNKDITDSIRYAKRIQEAILPSEKLIKAYLPNSFVFYKPKDIVSGDFYWIDKKSDQILLAAVDCTGHGVPGAFMSIVGHNLLKQSVDKNTGEPAIILDGLNKDLSDTFKQTTEDYKLRDGMDIAFCAINFEKKEIQFAGAYNPLYLIRDNKLQEMKGDNIAIGSFHELEQKYSNHKLPIEKGDVIYIFSDGYTDQFGGPEGKKFKSNKLKDLLLEINALTMEEQKKILVKTIEQWKGELEQVDDILIIGVKI
ncbi:MAG TPA: two-component regulator propeller domain-containing protein [Bacteroidia bacterium]|nr:two-component regulator propeller domain-containing protein [Bacteroidia bacterium]